MNKHVKKILSISLSLLMGVSSIPAGAIAAYADTPTPMSVQQAPENLNRDPSLNKYLFAYFLGESDTHVRFAVSTDGYNFEALNGNQTLLNTQANDATAVTWNGKTGIPCSGGARDPYIIRKVDGNGFWVVATDLDTSYGKTNAGVSTSTLDHNYNNSKLLVWDLDDINNIGNATPWAVDTSGLFGDTYYGAGKDYYNSKSSTTQYKNVGVSLNYCSWAPEVIYDTEKSMYMLYWSDGLYDDLRIHYMYTNDFRTFYDASGNLLDGVNHSPQVLYNPGVKSIDGDITYDNASGKYYMVFKKEAEGQLYIVESTHASGPYTNERKFTDSNITGTSSSGGNGIAMEGPEVYQLTDGSYVLCSDVYTSGSGMFQAYKNDSLANISGNNYIGNKMNINHLGPRHGGFAYITTNEYNQLVNTYGLTRFTSSGIPAGTNVNDYLVARYFTTDDVTYDASGNGNTLTNNNNVTTEQKIFEDNEVTAAKFDAANSSYMTFNNVAFRKNGQMIDFNEDDGITITWRSWSEDDNNQLYHWIFGVAGNGLTKGVFTKGDANDHKDSNYLGFCANDVYTLSGQNDVRVTYQPDTDLTGSWHKYCMTISKGAMVLFKDGRFYTSVYQQDTSVNNQSGKATPVYTPLINNTWINDLFENGTLMIGASLYSGDATFTGNICDFRIYNKDLIHTDILRSTALLSLGSIDDALSEYEEIMSSGKVYTGMADAYKAYVQLKKARDTYLYGKEGTVTEADLTEYLTDLAIAKSSMTEYSADSFVNKNDDAYTSFNVKDDNTKYPNFTSQNASRKLAYAGTEQANSSNGQPSATWTGNSVTGNMYYGTNILLYTGDGDNPRFPAAFSWNCTGRNINRYVYTVYPASDGQNNVTNNDPNFRVNMTNAGNQYTDIWYGYDTRLNYAYCLGEGHSAMVGGDAANSHSAVSTKLTAGSIFGSGTSASHYYASAIEYVGTPTKLLEDYTITWNARISDKNNTAIGSATLTSATASTHTYVLNYKMVEDVTKDASSILSDVDITQYQEGGLLPLLEAFDEVTGFDFDITGTSDIPALGSRLQTAIDTLSGFSVSDECEEDAQEYADIRESMDEAKTIIDTLDTSNYSPASIAAYRNIFESTQEIMDTILDNGYVDNDAVESNSIALNNVLNENLDVSPLTEAITAKETITLENNGEQTYTLSSYLDNKDTLEAEKIIRDELAANGKFDTVEETYSKADGSTVKYRKVLSTTSNVDKVQSETEKVNNLDYEEVSPDYSAYDAFMIVYQTQDMNAFTDEYKNQKDSVVYLSQINGTSTSAPKYDKDNADMKDSAYVEYEGNIYKNSADIDHITFAMMTSLNMANEDITTKRKSYDVTLEVYEDGVLKTTLKNNEKHYYGDVIDLDVSSATNGYTCYKWDIYSEEDNSSKTATRSSNSYTLRIQNNSVIKAYYSTKKSSVDTINLVVKTLYNQTAHDITVSRNSTITFGDKEIDIDGVVYTLPSYNFYKLKNWKIGSRVYSSGDSIKISDITSADVLTITTTFENSNGNFDIKLDGQTVNANVPFDTKVTVTSPGAYAIVQKMNNQYYVVAYGETYQFFACSSVELFTVHKEDTGYSISGFPYAFDENTIYKLDNHLPFVLDFAMITGDNSEKFTTMVVVSNNVDVKITEFGIIYTTDENVANSNNFEYGKNGVSVLKAKSTVSTGNSFSVTANNAKDKYQNGTVLYTRGYVKYSYTYTNPVNNETSTIQCIEYGPAINDIGLF